MHELKIRKIHCENFKCFKQSDFDFFGMTRISGRNGIGKSTVATAIMWTLFGVDYDLTNNPKVRREVDGQPVNDVPVTVEITMDYDGKEVMVRKTQKRSISKNGEIADSNSYAINGVNKTLRDFNAYFDFSFDDLLMCMNPAAFLAQKPAEMRKFLFKLPKNVTDSDIVAMFPELSGLSELLEKYSADEITAMNKSSISRLTKEINEYPGRIDEVNRQIVEDVDVAELELKINALKEQIADIERQESDALSQSGELESMQKNIMELRSEKAAIENKAFQEIMTQRTDLQVEINRIRTQISGKNNSLQMAELDKQRLESTANRKKSEKDDLLSEYEKIAADTYPEFEPLPDLSESSLICPTCGQEFPAERKEQILAEHEARKQKHLEGYNENLAYFEKEKERKLSDITEQGRRLRDEIKEIEDSKIPEVTATISNLKKEIEADTAQLSGKQAELNVLPSEPNLCENQEYEALCLEISTKEDALRKFSSGIDVRAEFRRRKAEIQSELDSAKGQLARVNNNVVLENRIEELRTEQIQKSQSKADCERILDLLAELDKKKNEYLVADINKHFWRVTWRLWELQKNGGYLTCCVPMIDGFDIRNTANHGRVLEAQMDVALSIQKIVGINAPVLLDNAEALDSGNLKRILTVADCQMIVFAVSDSNKMETEVIENVD